MPCGGAIIFSDLIGKLDVLRVACDKCGRAGRYRLARLIDQRGRDGPEKLAGRSVTLLTHTSND
jgi:hypothetical protein